LAFGRGLKIYRAKVACLLEPQDWETEKRSLPTKERSRRLNFKMRHYMATTGLVFFVIGAVKSRWSVAGWAKSGLETLLIGMSAAGLSFLIGFGLRAFVRVPF